MKEKNAVLYLFAKNWHYSEKNRKNIILYWILFTIGNALTLICNPLIWAEMINVIDKQGVTSRNISYLFGLLAMTLILDVIFWVFHGPARTLEELNAFRARAAYKKFL